MDSFRINVELLIDGFYLSCIKLTYLTTLNLSNLIHGIIAFIWLYLSLVQINNIFFWKVFINSSILFYFTKYMNQVPF